MRKQLTAAASFEQAARGGRLQVADVRAQVAVSLITDFVNFSQFVPNAYHVPEVETMLDQVAA